MAQPTIILSVRPEHAQKIFTGQKTVELRRSRLKKLRHGTVALVYVSSPIRSLAGAFRVTNVVEEPLKELWRIVKERAGLSFREFKQYYDGVETGIAIFFEKVWTFAEPLTLHELRLSLTAFFPPQAYRYVRAHELQSPLIQRLLSRIKHPKT